MINLFLGEGLLILEISIIILIKQRILLLYLLIIDKLWLVLLYILKIYWANGIKFEIILEFTWF
jgi:hypothetical protein